MSLSSEQVIFYFVRSQRRYTIIVTLPPSLILNKWSFATNKKTQHEPINAISQQRIDGGIHAPAGACQQKLTKDIGIDEIFE